MLPASTTCTPAALPRTMGAEAFMVRLLCTTGGTGAAAAAAEADPAAALAFVLLAAGALSTSVANTGLRSGTLDLFAAALPLEVEGVKSLT
jgi:hypothetical protein